MRHIRPWKSPPVRLLLSVCSGLLRTAAGVLLCAAALLMMQMPEWLLGWISTILWCIGAYGAGECLARHTGRHGLGCGLLCGGVMCILLLAGAWCFHSSWGLRMLVRCSAMLLAAMCGGVRGVNRRMTKPPN